MASKRVKFWFKQCPDIGTHGAHRWSENAVMTNRTSYWCGGYGTTDPTQEASPR